MDVFEFAMQMETDGKAMYEEHAAKVEIPELKQILLELAADEQKHYNLFKAMSEGKTVDYDEGSKTNIVASVKNVFQQLKEQDKDFTFGSDAREVWDKARDIEKKSEAFYRSKMEEVETDAQKNVLKRIADEELRHWQMIEHVIQFLDRPKSWLEDAEWNKSEE